MKKVHAVLFAFLMMTMSLAGCLSGDAGEAGEDGAEGVAGPAGEDGSSLHMVVSSTELPDCDSAHLGHIYFVSGEGAFQVCSTSGWAVVDLTGPEGPAGADGLDGADGTNGTDGADGADGTDGTDGADGIDGSPSPDTMLTSVTTPDISMGCTAGGHIMAQGLDNGDGGGTAQNGILEAGEVDYTTTYCSEYVAESFADSGNGDFNHIISKSVVVGNEIYFAADDGIHGFELWVLDTDSGQTSMVWDINVGQYGSSPGIMSGFVAVNDTIYFGADDGLDFGGELYAFNILNQTGWCAWDIETGVGSSTPGGNIFYVMTGPDGDWTNNFIVFDAYNSTRGRELFVYTQEGGYQWNMATDIYGAGASSNPGKYGGFLQVGQQLYFDARGDDGDYELWAFNFTFHVWYGDGSYQVEDIYPGVASSYPGCFTLYNDKMYFAAKNTSSGMHLWEIDNPAEETPITSPISYVATPESGGLRCSQGVIGNFDDTFYYTAYRSGVNGWTFWAYNFSQSIGYYLPGIPSGDSGWSFTWAGEDLIYMDDNIIYFSGLDSSDGDVSYLWAHDTLTNSTWRVSNDCTRPGWVNLQIMLDDILFFDCNKDEDRELWAYDTNNQNFWMLADVTNHGDSRLYSLGVVENELFFYARHWSIYGTAEIWKLGIEHSITYD